MGRSGADRRMARNGQNPATPSNAKSGRIVPIEVHRPTVERPMRRLVLAGVRRPSAPRCGKLPLGLVQAVRDSAIRLPVGQLATPDELPAGRGPSRRWLAKTDQSCAARQ